MDDYSFTKGTIEKYDIRFGEYGDWAIFTIDNATGLLQCHSSYGDWQYAWPRHGRKTFKHFILELERDWQYLLKKVSDKVYDDDATKEKYIRIVLEQRKNRYCTKEQVRKAYDFIDELDFNSEDLVYNSIISSDEIQDLDIYDAWEIFEPVKNYSHSDMFFAKKIIPTLCDIIRKELASEVQANE